MQTGEWISEPNKAEQLAELKERSDQMKIRRTDNSIIDILQIESLISRTDEFKTEEKKLAKEVIAEGEDNDYYILLAEDNSLIVGFICFGPIPITNNKTWDIYWIAVDKDYRKQRIGESLLDYAEKEIEEQKGKLILIETSSSESNKAARNLYSSKGYDVVALIRNFYGPKDNKIIFGKEIKNENNI